MFLITFLKHERVFWEWALTRYLQQEQLFSLTCTIKAWSPLISSRSIWIGLILSFKFSSKWKSIFFSKTKIRDYTSATGGVLTLGGTSSSYYTGSIYYTPLSTASYWKFKLTGILISGTTVITTNQYAIADTGTTLIIGPSSNIISINNYIGATRVSSSSSTWYLSSCSLRASMPSSFYLFKFILRYFSNFYK